MPTFPYGNVGITLTPCFGPAVYVVTHNGMDPGAAIATRPSQ